MQTCDSSTCVFAVEHKSSQGEWFTWSIHKTEKEANNVLARIPENSTFAWRVVKQELIGQAHHDFYANDLFWSFFIPEENKIIRWTGYDDAYWWTRVATSDQFRTKTAKNGYRYRLDPTSNKVYRIL